MNALFVAFGIDLPKAGTVVETRTVIVSLLVGTVVTVIASIVPALRATRVPPISAVREGSAAPARKRGPLAALVTIGVSLAALATGLFAASGGVAALLLGLGVLTLFVGIALLAPRLVKPIASVVGLPATRFGGSAGRLARDNAVRNPGRTASTAAALMIGLALVTLVATLGAGLRTSTSSAVSKQIDTDYVVTAKANGDSYPSKADAAIAEATGVTAISGVRSDTARVAGDETPVSGIDPATIGRFYRYTWTHGGLKGLDDAGTVVSKGFADQHHLCGREPPERGVRQRQDARADRARHLRPAEDGPAAGRRQHQPARVRRRLPAPAEPVHVRRGQLAGRAGQGDRGLPGRPGGRPRGVRHRPHGRAARRS